jgi:hypothetical protein
VFDRFTDRCHAVEILGPGGELTHLRGCEGRGGRDDVGERGPPRGRSGLLSEED